MLAHKQLALGCSDPVCSAQPSGMIRRRQQTPFTQSLRSVRLQHCSRRMVHVRAAADPQDPGEESDDDFEARLAKIRKKSGPAQTKEKTPYEQLQENKRNAASGGTKNVDWGQETVWLETPPARGDLAVNIAFGATLLWLPLTIAAIGRAAFIKYKFTDKRISVITSAPWKSEQLDAAYSQVKRVQSIGRGIGLWGDMVVELKNGDKIEMRALPKHKEVEKYIKEQVAAATDAGNAGAGKSKGKSTKGFGN